MALDAVIDANAQVSRIATGFGFTEGPVFSRRGYLLFSDIPNNRIHRWERGEVSVWRENSNGANGLTFDHQGRLLSCEIGRLARTEKNGAITTLAADGVKRANDVVYSIDGSVYFTDPPTSKVFQVRRTGEVRVVAEDCEGPNGIALSPNQQKLYVADARKRLVRIYDIAPDGMLRNSKLFAECRCDGLKTDESGNVWVASEGGIWVFDAAGTKLGVIATPEAPSNCNWGAGFRGLYITARTSVYLIPTKVAGTRTY